MKKIVMFDTSHGTQNLGDYIIMRCINEEMSYLLDENFIARFSTHTPISRWRQLLRKGATLKFCELSSYKFLCGTNLFKKSLIRLNCDWNMSINSIPFYKNSIALGCGLDNNSKKTNTYTKHIYKSILSKKYIHSCRDEKTKEFLETLGVKATNTGCPTMWKLTKKHCKKIPENKSENVVFTLTDYKKDLENDQKLINILKENYKDVYFWIQGSNDLDYINGFENIENIKIINPSLDEFENILKKGNIDYVGTRLHAGIFAMRNFVRSIILIVDNRARDIKETYNIVAVEREKILNELPSLINSEFKTEINIDEEKIKKWKKQFEDNVNE